MIVQPGQDADLTVVFTDDQGQPVDPTSITADIFDPDNSLVVEGEIPVRLSEGFYLYTWLVPEDAELGEYRVEWRSTIGGNSAFGFELFDVSNIIDGGIVAPADMQQALRDRLDEKTEALFSNDDIVDILFMHGNNLDEATVEGWQRKMARYARLVDVSESGTDRKMSQKFKNAQAMVKFWQGVLDATATIDVGRYRTLVVGRVVNLRGTGSQSLLTPFSGYADHVREYPTHRLVIPAILG